MKPNLLPFIAEKWASVPQPTTSFLGKTIILTGANVGLGFEAANKFVSLGADRVILGVRNISKGGIAAQQIEERTKRKGIVAVWELDMERYASIEHFAARAKTELSRIDVVILNAGVTCKDYTIGPEGWESTLQVNVMGTALLALLLLPILQHSKASNGAPSHLIIVTSEAHRWLEDKDIPSSELHSGSILKAVDARPSDPKTWDGLQQNAKSKLFAMYIAREISSLMRQENGEVDVIVTPTCPGACRSDLMRHMKESGFIAAMGLKFFDLLFSKTTEEGARVYVAAASLGIEGHGGWYKTTALTRPGDLVTSDKGKMMQQKVWMEIVESLMSKVPIVRDIVSKNGGAYC